MCKCNTFMYVGQQWEEWMLLGFVYIQRDLSTMSYVRNRKKGLCPIEDLQGTIHILRNHL